MANKIYYTHIDGFIPSQAKRIAKFALGDYLWKFKTNLEKRKFQLYISKDTPDEILNEIEDHFTCFSFIYVNFEEDETIEE